MHNLHILASKKYAQSLDFTGFLPLGTPFFPLGTHDLPLTPVPKGTHLPLTPVPKGNVPKGKMVG